jgi:hypothetical protein
MFQQSEGIDKLAAALATASAEMSNPPLDGKNPHFKSKFATLACVRDTVTPTLSKYGLAVSQFPCEVDGVGPGLCTVLMHQSGQYMRATIALRPAKHDPQGIGAAMTYARRYGLQAVCGVVGDDDDDGEHASRPAPQRQQAPQPAQRKPLWEDEESFFNLMREKRKAWPQLVAWINEKHGGKYPPDTGFFYLSADHRKIAADALTGAK